MACAAASMLGPFLLIFFSLGDFGLTNGSAGVTDDNSQSTIPLGIFTDLSANDKVMLVGLSSPKPNCLYTDYGNRFTLAPKSSSALSMQVPPMLTEIVGDLGSLYFTGVLL